MESMEELYRKHAGTVYAFLLSRTRDAGLAEELTQETFFQAIEGIKKFRGDSSVVTWLCGIARNLWRSYAREQGRREELSQEEELMDPRQVEDQVLLQWDSLRTLKLLHGLKEPMREVLYLRLIGNLSFGQIGEILGKSENWARVNFYRGKEKLIKEVREHE